MKSKLKVPVEISLFHTYNGNGDALLQCIKPYKGSETYPTINSNGEMIMKRRRYSYKIGTIRKRKNIIYADGFWQLYLK